MEKNNGSAINNESIRIFCNAGTGFSRMHFLVYCVIAIPSIVHFFQSSAVEI